MMFALKMPSLSLWEIAINTMVSSPTTNSKEQEQRFISLIKEHESLISAICFSYASSVADYEDLRQDALLNIWRGFESFKQQSSLRTWIYRVVINSCVSTVRKAARHKKASVQIESLFELLPDESSEEKERIEHLHGMIARLNAEDKAVIMMWLDDASYEEIASVMGISKNNVAVRLHRIREKLSNSPFAS